MINIRITLYYYTRSTLTKGPGKGASCTETQREQTARTLPSVITSGPTSAGTARLSVDGADERFWQRRGRGIQTKEGKHDNSSADIADPSKSWQNCPVHDLLFCTFPRSLFFKALEEPHDLPQCCGPASSPYGAIRSLNAWREAMLTD